MQNKMRIAKFIANAGYCSRREAEKLNEKKIFKIKDYVYGFTNPEYQNFIKITSN